MNISGCTIYLKMRFVVSIPSLNPVDPSVCCLSVWLFYHVICPSVVVGTLIGIMHSLSLLTLIFAPWIERFSPLCSVCPVRS